MTQAYEQQAIEIEIEEKEQKTAQKVNERKVDALIGNQTPKYYERVMTPKQARQKRWAKYGARPSI